MYEDQCKCKNNVGYCLLYFNKYHTKIPCRELTLNECIILNDINLICDE